MRRAWPVPSALPSTKRRVAQCVAGSRVVLSRAAAWHSVIGASCISILTPASAPDQRDLTLCPCLIVLIVGGRPYPAQGQYQVKPPLPFIPGSEVSGIVTEVGPEAVSSIKPGDRVCAICMGGAFAEEVVVAETSVWLVPGVRLGVKLHHRSSIIMQGGLVISTPNLPPLAGALPWSTLWYIQAGSWGRRRLWAPQGRHDATFASAPALPLICSQMGWNSRPPLPCPSCTGLPSWLSGSVPGSRQVGNASSQGQLQCVGLRNMDSLIGGASRPGDRPGFLGFDGHQTLKSMPSDRLG